MLLRWRCPNSEKLQTHKKEEAAAASSFHIPTKNIRQPEGCLMKKDTDYFAASRSAIALETFSLETTRALTTPMIRGQPRNRKVIIARALAG